MKRVILLTATVHPSIVDKNTGTSIQRRSEYLDAINYYLNNTAYPIVIVDNSNYKFMNDFTTSDRFEALSFQGDDIGKGKGWGECQILKYALMNSSFLRDSDQIIKITGRLIIHNINSILINCNSSNDIYADSNLSLSYTHSYFFVAPPSFFIKEIFNRHEMMNDKKGVHFEHILGISIKSWCQRYNYHEFKLPLYIVGHPGNSNKKYLKPSIKRYIVIYIKYIINELIRFTR